MPLLGECSAPFPDGTGLTLTASGSTFVSWRLLTDGGVRDLNPDCMISPLIWACFSSPPSDR